MQIAMLVALHMLYAALGFLEPPQGDDLEPHFAHHSWFASVFSPQQVPASMILLYQNYVTEFHLALHILARICHNSVVAKNNTVCLEVTSIGVE